MSRYRKRRREVYFIPQLTKTEYATLKWLSDHGYDGGILEAAGVEEEYDDGGAKLGGLTEFEAWTVKDSVDEDPHAFLASSGCRSLNEKLWKFLDQIV
jgi:hypothetical protein